MSEPLDEVRLPRAVLVVVDSLRADFVTAQRTPHLHRLTEQGCRFTNHRSVFPSTTRTASASIATGCHPRNHGLLGNTVALEYRGRMKAVSTASADFRDLMAAALGHTLTRPTLAERLAPHGGAITFSNASPGAAQFQDPDGFGYLYNRAFSYGPGRKAVPDEEALTAEKGAEGDAATTQRFIEEVVRGIRPALGTLWLSEPDHTGHHHPLGSPEHLQAVAAADACVGQVLDAVSALEEQGDDILLVVTSDHGQETTERVIDIDQLLVDAGIKRRKDSEEVVVASQGSAALFFMADADGDTIDELVEFLATQDWAEEIYDEATLDEVGLDVMQGLVCAVSMGKTDRSNEYGVPGCTDIALNPLDDLNTEGCGQHGGAGPFEQSPFLILRGGGFKAGTRASTPSSCIDIAPTILRHLGLNREAGLDGRPLLPE